VSKRPNFFYHLHPPTLPAREARWSYTFGLGGITLLLFLILCVTGVLELFYYIPTADGANESLRWIAHVIPYGWLIRNVHFWAGQLMVIIVGLHMARVVFTGAYKRPRRLNWLIGLALLVLTGLLDFTGYVLRWDEGTSWALLVGTNLLREVPLIGRWLYGLAVGGPAISSVTVVRFYGWHIFGLALPAFILIAWHGWRVRRDGGISHVAFRPRVNRAVLVRLEAITALLVLALVIGLAVLFDPALGPPADLSRPVAEATAPWFFRWVQEALRWAPPLLAGVALPVGSVLLLALIPYLVDRGKEGVAVWFNRPGRLAQVLFLVIVGLVVTLTILGELH